MASCKLGSEEALGPAGCCRQLLRGGEAWHKSQGKCYHTGWKKEEEEEEQGRFAARLPMASHGLTVLTRYGWTCSRREKPWDGHLPTRLSADPDRHLILSSLPHMTDPLLTPCDDP